MSTMNPLALEHHYAGRGGWLRAAVLGANDGLVSTASLMVGVAGAGAGTSAVVTAGVAAVAAGALSMAVGEYVSVSSQSDIEVADEAMERQHLAEDPVGELEELTLILQSRGMTRETAERAAKEMSEFDLLETHLREELGRHEHNDARPMQAAVASAASFIAGGIIPFLGLLIPGMNRTWAIVLVTIIGLGGAGTFSGIASGMNPVKPTTRVLLGGVLAMAITFGVGRIFGTTVG
jgi:VIT1/CCC1 family predicted Fe2+/Mn2+ transporter